MAKSKSQKSKSSSATIGFEQQIWDAACELWGHIPAADYRKIFTGLIFLKYISTAFEKKYKELVEEGDGFEDDPDAYEADNIFFVPPEARWSEIAKAAHTPEIGTILDKAMIAIEADNKSLKGVLPKNYANPELDKRVLGNVVDVFTNMDMSDTEASKDLLGRTSLTLTVLGCTSGILRSARGSIASRLKRLIFDYFGVMLQISRITQKGALCI